MQMFLHSITIFKSVQKIYKFPADSLQNVMLLHQHQVFYSIFYFAAVVFF